MIREHGVQTVREVLRLTTFRKEQGTLQNPMGFIIHCLKNGYDLQELEEKPWNEQEQLLVPGDQWKGIPTTIQDAIDLGIITPEQLRASG